MQRGILKWAIVASVVGASVLIGHTNKLFATQTRLVENPYSVQLPPRLMPSGMDSLTACKRAFAKYESTLKPDTVAAHRPYHRYKVHTFVRDPMGEGVLIRFKIDVPLIYGGGALVWVDENGTETILKRYA